MTHFQPKVTGHEVLAYFPLHVSREGKWWYGHSSLRIAIIRRMARRRAPRVVDAYGVDWRCESGCEFQEECGPSVGDICTSCWPHVLRSVAGECGIVLAGRALELPR